MAFYLTDSERQQWANTMLIPATEVLDTSLEFVTSESGVDAKVITVTALDEVTLNNYTSAGMTYEWVGDGKVDVTLDQDKYASPAIDRADDFNSFLDAVPQATDKIARAVARERMTYVFNLLATGTTNEVPAVTLDETNVLAWIADMQVAMDELEAPQDGRKLAVTPAVASLISRAAGAALNSDSIATESGRTGFLGVYGGFTIYKIPSAYLADGTAVGSKTCIATVPQATVMGTGYNEMRLTEDPKYFADILQMRIKYGARVIQPLFLVKSEVVTA